MANIYLCGVCDKWFPTQAALKAHRLSEHSPNKKVSVPVIPEKKKTVISDIELEKPVQPETIEPIDNESDEETEDVISRKQMVKALKEGGVITDSRSVSKKDDSEIADMYAVLQANTDTDG